MSFGMVLQQLVGGFGKTLLIFALTLLFSLPLGLLVCFGRMSRWTPLRKLRMKDGTPARGLRRWLSGFCPVRLLFQFLISVLRGTPLMLQLLVVCYGPYYIFRCSMSGEWRFTALILAFVINYSAYFAEIFRSGIQSIPVGQQEAAQVLGYSKAQTFFKIILPQMLKRVLPPVTNEVITLVKDTSMGFVLAELEMFTIAKQIAAAQTTIMPLFVAGLFYFLFNAAVAAGMERLERATAYYQ